MTTCLLEWCFQLPFFYTSVLPVVGHSEQPGSPVVPLNTVLGVGAVPGSQVVPLNTVLGVGAVVIVIIIVLAVVIGLVILRRMRVRQTITVCSELGK